MSEAISTGTFSTPAFVRGESCWLYDAQGRRFFDGTAGSGAISLGHQHPAVIAAARAQLEQLVHTGCKFGSDVRARFTQRLAEMAPFAACAVLPAVIGTEAVEAALKVARAATGRRSAISFRHAYHGKSAGALGLTWREQFRRYSTVDLSTVFVAELPDPAAADRGAEIERALRGLEAVFAQATSAGAPPAAIIVEPVQVTEGVLIAPAEYLERMIELCHARGTLVIFDEIYTGFGRCGRRFFCEGLSHKPDLLIVGKSLGNGFPISAVLGEAALINTLPAGIQTSTYTGNAVACAAAVAVMEEVERLALWDVAAALERALVPRLQRLAHDFDFVASYRSMGALFAFDCRDASGAPAPAVAQRFVETARDRGLLLFGGGYAGATVKIVPPVLLTHEQADWLGACLEEVAASCA
jgi:4-aminobutyrate aminotransferase / (S)-3-amino-2-methylpropionate transaminase / 5-aminovalerate transaminase